MKSKIYHNIALIKSNWNLFRNPKESNSNDNIIFITTLNVVNLTRSSYLHNYITVSLLLPIQLLRRNQFLVTSWAEWRWILPTWHSRVCFKDRTPPPPAVTTWIDYSSPKQIRSPFATPYWHTYNTRCTPSWMAEVTGTVQSYSKVLLCPGSEFPINPCVVSPPPQAQSDRKARHWTGPRVLLPIDTPSTLAQLGEQAEAAQIQQHGPVRINSAGVPLLPEPAAELSAGTNGDDESDGDNISNWFITVGN